MFYLMISSWMFSAPQPPYPYPMMNDLSWELHEMVISLPWERYARFWGAREDYFREARNV